MFAEEVKPSPEELEEMKARLLKELQKIAPILNTDQLIK